MESIIDRYYNLSVQGSKEDWFSGEISIKWYEYIFELSLKLRITYLVTILHNQVFNGGFDQYFINGYGQFSLLTIRALLDIEAYEKAFIVQKAYDSVNEDKLDDQFFRNKLLKKQIKGLFDDDKLIDELDLLSDEYYETENKVKILDLLTKYLKK
ncbi:DUF4375 domain-containing protein [Apibacter raozihei]|uniref:DMP19 family protein n=1 Tax=Apibacter raozihei TaxID=2500547 RepID=UPI000FE442BF|nr:DUF4375 domain-containing protein [Apibacter raozihei]